MARELAGPLQAEGVALFVTRELEKIPQRRRVLESCPLRVGLEPRVGKEPSPEDRGHLVVTRWPGDAQAGQAQLQPGAGVGAPCHCGAREHRVVVLTVRVEVSGLRQAAQDHVEIDAPCPDRERACRSRDQVWKAGSVVAEQDGVVNAGPPPEIFRRCTDIERADAIGERGLARTESRA